MADPVAMKSSVQQSMSKPAHCIKAECSNSETHSELCTKANTLTQTKQRVLNQVKQGSVKYSISGQHCFDLIRSHQRSLE